MTSDRTSLDLDSNNRQLLSDAIKIEVSSQYIAGQSTPEQNKYFFSYTINIINLSDQDVILKSRYWRITDSNGQLTEVEGEGVVGKTPTIKPKTAYQYSSATLLKTPIGFMEGHYIMHTANQLAFNANIPLFRLATPNLIH